MDNTGQLYRQWVDYLRHTPEANIDFGVTAVPSPGGCGSVGCYLGWGAVMLKLPTVRSTTDGLDHVDGGLAVVARKFGFTYDGDFYEKMPIKLSSDAPNVAIDAIEAYGKAKYPEAWNDTKPHAFTDWFNQQAMAELEAA